MAMDRLDTRVPEAVLEDFGVPSNAQAIWRILLANPDSRPRELGQLTGLSVKEVAPALDALVEARLVRPSSAPAGVTAIDPALVIETHIARAERQIAERAEQFAELRALIPEFAHEYARGRPTGTVQAGVEVITELSAIRRQIYLASETTTADARSMYHSTTVEGVRDGLQADLEMMRRGVRCRSIVGPNDLADPDLYAELEVCHAQGELFRALPDIPTRLMIFDRSAAVLRVDPGDIRLGAIFIRARSLIDMLILLFDHLWSVADPIFTTSLDPDAPTGRRARTLELISIGTTDERIARSLGVGARTIGRDVSDLKASLRVSSRVEIATAALRRGWL
jgi:DNA-binding CsgD family transcriptional regulator/sugar-specific transcriptional regulator TrmB